MRLLEACRAAQVRRIVYASSSSVYGDTAVLPKTEAVEPLPRSPYAASKLAGEQYVLAFARGGLVEGVALRYFNVFGPRQSPHSAYAALIPALLLAALEQREATLFGDGTQTRDRSEEHTSELQSQSNLVCRLLLEKKKKKQKTSHYVVVI